MATFEFYSRLPEENYVGDSIPMEDFLRFGDIGPASQRNCRYYFVSANCMFIFKEKDKDSQNELHIFELRVINSAEGWMTVWNVVKSFIQAIPYHVLLVLREGERFQFFIADFHEGIRKFDKHVVDRLISTPRYHEKRESHHDISFYDAVAKILTNDSSVEDKHKSLKEAIIRTLQEPYYCNLEMDLLDRRAEEERYLSKRELERDREFGHVPYDWLFQYGIAPIKTLFEIWEEDTIEEEWD